MDERWEIAKREIKTMFGWDDAELEKKIKRVIEIFGFKEEEDGIAFLYEVAKTKESLSR